MLLIGESTRPNGHADALWAAAILHVLDPKFKVLAWARGPRHNSLVHFAQFQKHFDLLTVAAIPTRSLRRIRRPFPRRRYFLATPIAPVATLPIAIAMASGLPIVATASRNVGELLEDRHTALLAAPHSPRASPVASSTLRKTPPSNGPSPIKPAPKPTNIFPSPASSSSIAWSIGKSPPVKLRWLLKR